MFCITQTGIINMLTTMAFLEKGSKKGLKRPQKRVKIGNYAENWRALHKSRSDNFCTLYGILW